MTSISKSQMLESFHIERSRCIDAFAEVEELVVALLDLLGCKSNSEPFGHKIERLKEAKATSQFSKQRLHSLQSQLTECTALTQIRNDIVHARLQLAEMDNQSRACFVNTKQCLSAGQSARLFTLEGLRGLHDRLRRLASELKQVLINPACMTVQSQVAG